MWCQQSRFILAITTLCLLKQAAWGQMDSESKVPTLQLQVKHVLKLQNRPSWLSFSRDGSRFASNDGSSVKVWDTRTWKQLVAYTGMPVYRAELSPDGRRLAFTEDGPDSDIRLLDVASGKEVGIIEGTHERH